MMVRSVVAETAWDKAMLLIQELCSSRENLLFIDLMPYFQLDWIQSHKYFNSEANPHWDGYGNAVVTEAIYQDVVNAF